MTKEEHIEYWIESAKDDEPLIADLFDKGYYLWSLFILHLVVEKLLKARYVKVNTEDVPKIHNLLSLAKKSTLDLSETQISLLDRLNLFQIAARYPDYKKKLHTLCTKEFTFQFIKETKEFIEWLKSQ